MEWKRGPVIGQGSSATVSIATTSTGDILAVKSTYLSTSVFLQKEQQFLSQLTSKHVIRYMGFDVNYDNNKPIYNLFMEYATGGTISDMIKKQGGSLDESLIRSYTHQILLGLEHLHVNNVVHCDIKCQNLLICEDGVKIGDLGCAKKVENSVSQFSGTPVFMAPEVARGEEQGFPADVWALGCVIIEMATGFNPWPEINDPVSGLYKIGYSGDVPEFPKWLPEDGKDFLDKCLKIDFKERWNVKELMKHPFVSNSISSSEIRNSPTSTLDQGFWESLSVSEASTELIQIDGFSGEAPVERIRQLVEGVTSCLLPNWDNDEEDWITVRSNEINEMNVEDGGFGSTDVVESFSFTNSNVDYEEEEEEIERLVVSDVDYEVLEYSIVSRDLYFEDMINDIFFAHKKIQCIYHAFRSLFKKSGFGYSKL